MAVLAGGGGAGGSGGNASKKGKGKKKLGTKKGKKSATGGKKTAPDPKKYPKCGTKAHPVDVITGRAFTHELIDLELGGPLELTFERMYSVSAKQRDIGLGYGWSHSFAWRIEVRKRYVRVWNDQGMPIDFPQIAVADSVIGPFGWLLRRETWGYILDTDEEVYRLFSASIDNGRELLLTAVEDFNGNRISLTYDDGHLVEIVDSAGRVVRVQTTREGRMASLAVKNAPSQGRWVEFARYEYDDRGDLVRVLDADGYEYRYAYDDQHRMIADTDRVGLTFHFRFDDQDRCVESWGAYDGRPDPSLAPNLPTTLGDGVTPAKGIHHCKFIYHDDSTEVIDSTQVIRYFGNEFGTIEKSVDGGAVETATYDDRGNMTSLSDGEGNTTIWEHDERGRVTRRIDPNGTEINIEYDGYGLPVRIEEAGFVNQFHRDARGNPEQCIDAAGGVEQWRYDARGLPVEQVTAAGARLLYAWDAQGNLVEETFANGAKRQYEHNAFGWVIAERDVTTGATVRYVYSDRGDLIAEHHPDGGTRRFEYDGEEHVVLEISAEGEVTRAVWGGYEAVCAIVDANGREIRFLYNREGELIEIRNEAGESYRYEYDSAGRCVAEMSFDGRRTDYRYDYRNLVTRVVTHAGEVHEFIYDATEQLVERINPDGSSDVLEYDARGSVVSASSNGVTVHYEYDANGNVTRERQIVDGVEEWVAWQYDPDGDLIRKETSRGHTEEIRRDNAGLRQSTLLDGRFLLQHENDHHGGELRRVLPRGGEIQTSFNVMGAVERLRVVGPRRPRTAAIGEPELVGVGGDGATIDRTFQYDLDGRLLDRHDRARGRTQYRYDPIGQILAVIPERALGEAFVWDPRGNPTETSEPRRYGAGNQLLEKGSTTYRYDEDGRLVSKTTALADGGTDETTYEWNGNALAAVNRGDVRVELRYDAFGRRMQKREVRRTDAGLAEIATTRFVWDGDALAHELRTDATGVRERTFWFVDTGFEPLGHRDGDAATGEWLLYVTDTIGVPTELIDAGGDVVATLDRTTWGRTQGSAPTPLRFQGQYEDEETGLAYNRFRYYDPDTGLYISPDPIGMSGGINNYAYAPDPLAWIDPAGLAKKSALAARLDKLPSSPGIYTVSSVNPKTGKTEWYVGQGVDVKGRLCSKGHKKANKILKRPGSKLSVKKVNTKGVTGGKGVTKKQAEKRALHVAERKQYDAMAKKHSDPAKSKTLNSHPPLGDKKYPSYSKKYPPKMGRAKSY